MFSVTNLLLGNVLPLLLAVIVLILAARPRQHGDRPRGAWGGPLGLVAALVAGFAVIAGGLPALPPAAVIGWVFWSAILLGLVGVVQSLPPWPPRRRWVPMAETLVTLLVCCCLMGLLIPPAIRDQWSSTQRGLWLGGLGLGATAWWFVFERLARHRSVMASLTMALAGTAISILLLLTAGIVYARVAGVLAGAAGVALPVLLLFPALTLRHGTAFVFAPLAFGMLGMGLFLSDDATPLTPVMFALVASAPVLMGLSLLLPIRRVGLRWTLALVVLIAPLATAAALATPAFFRSIDETVY